MKEDFLHFIWQFQLFNKTDIQTSEGDSLEVLDPGTPNSDGGPDFLNSRLRIGEIDWAGHVEIHIKASDWIRHKHQKDPNYNNVILHVVLENDRAIEQAGETLNTLELNRRVFYQYQKNYELLISNMGSIPCQEYIDENNMILLRSMIDRLIIDRIQKKSMDFQRLLDDQLGDWEEAIFRWICIHFGFKKNKEPFLELADLIGWRSVRKVNKDKNQLEALFFGVGGFLRKGGSDEYSRSLHESFQLLKKKVDIDKRVIDGKRWQFFRLRPSNFPTLRIAQLAAFLQNKDSLLDTFLGFTTVSSEWEIFDGNVDPYWKTRVRFSGEGSEEIGGDMGKKSRENLAINIIPPILYSYSKYSGNELYQDRAISIYESIPPESNKIVKNWKALGFEMESSFDTQAFLELQNSYCNKKQCLSCNMGTHLVREGFEQYGMAV